MVVEDVSTFPEQAETDRIALAVRAPEHIRPAVPELRLNMDDQCLRRVEIALVSAYRLIPHRIVPQRL